jgi:hypothetical protein
MCSVMTGVHPRGRFRPIIRFERAVEPTPNDEPGRVSQIERQIGSQARNQILRSDPTNVCVTTRCVSGSIGCYCVSLLVRRKQRIIAPSVQIGEQGHINFNLLFACGTAIYKNQPPENNSKDSIHTEHDQEERRSPIRDLILCQRKRSYGEMRKIPKRDRPGIDATDGAIFGNPICERKGEQ